MARVFHAEVGQAAVQHGLDAVAGPAQAIRRNFWLAMTDREVICADVGMRCRLAGLDTVFQREPLPGPVNRNDDAVAIEHGDRGWDAIQGGFEGCTFPKRGCRRTVPGPLCDIIGCHAKSPAPGVIRSETTPVGVSVLFFLA